MILGQFKLEERITVSENSFEIYADKESKSLVVDKVLRILKQVKLHLDTTLSSRELIKNLGWAIHKIENSSLYTTAIEEILDDNDEINIEEKEFLEGFQDFSFVNSIYKQSRERIVCRTATPGDFMQLKNIRENLRNQKQPNLKLKSIIDEDEELLPSKTSFKFNQLSKCNSYMGSNVNSSNNIQGQVANGKVDVASPMDSLNLVESSNKKNYHPIEDDELINYKIELGRSVKEITSDKFQNYDMNSIINRNFNIYNFESVFGREKSFVLIGKEMIRSLDLTSIIDCTKLENYLIELRNAYIPENYYHNERHGADVGQTTSSYLKESEIIDICFLQDLDILSIVVAAISHDVGHPGLNNNFQINNRTDVALVYHDKSVLENYHIFMIFKILKKTECNIVCTLKKDDYNVFRKRIIETIIATDMFYHGKVVSSLKNKLFNWKELKKINEDELLINPNSKTLFDDQQEIINLAVHGADISHNTKPFKLSEKWTELLTEEFHVQGDNEKNIGLPISFLCDRQLTNVPKSQISFISFVILPTFEVLVDAFPSLDYLVKNAKANMTEWEIRVQKQLVNT